MHWSFRSFCVTAGVLAGFAAGNGGAAAGAGSCGAGSDGTTRSCAPPAPAGLALLAVQWRRTLRAVDDLDGPNASTEANVSSKSLVAASGVINTSMSTGKRSTSYSLSVASQGDGLSGSASAGVENESLPPISEEHFDPFGYPGAGLLLELHMPEITLKGLHGSSHGSLAQLLLELRGEICKGAKVQEPRISILGIHGRYKRYDTSGGLFHLQSERDGRPKSDRIDEEVVVRFEILPGWTHDLDPRQALAALREELGSSQGELMKGPLSTLLVNSTISLSAPVGIGTQPRMIEHRGMAHMSAMAWPIGISAAFIGILIWLAAY